MSFFVNEEGILIYSGYILGLDELPKLEVQIPVHVLGRGAKAIRAYAENQIEIQVRALQTIESQLRNESRKRRENLKFLISLNIDSVEVGGNIVYTKNPQGQQLLTVVLFEPKIYACTGELYWCKYGSSKLTEKDGSLSKEGIKQGEKLLEKLYRQKQREFKHPEAYAALQLLRDAKKTH